MEQRPGEVEPGQVPAHAMKPSPPSHWIWRSQGTGRHQPFQKQPKVRGHGQSPPPLWKRRTVSWGPSSPRPCHLTSPPQRNHSQHRASCPHLSSHSMNYTPNPSSHKAPLAVREGLTIALIHHSLDDHWEHTPVQVKVQLRRKDQSGGQEGSRTDGTTALPLLGRDMNLPFKCSQGAMLQPRAPRNPAIHCLSMTPSPTPCEYTYTLPPSVSEPPSPTVMAGICTLAGPTFPITTNREGTKSQSCVQPL